MPLWIRKLRSPYMKVTARATAPNSFPFFFPFLFFFFLANGGLFNFNKQQRRKFPPDTPPPRTFVPRTSGRSALCELLTNNCVDCVHRWRSCWRDEPERLREGQSCTALKIANLSRVKPTDFHRDLHDEPKS